MEAVLEDLGGPVASILANNSVLSRGLVLRSSSNQISVQFSSEWPAQPGLLLLRYRAFALSCASLQAPENGEVSVTGLQVEGVAYFSCLIGYQIQGPSSLTCRNATTPYWSGREPRCQVACGGMMRNATQGRIVSLGFPGNYSNNLTCHWVLEAPEGHRLHVHFEKVALAEDDDRHDGSNIDSLPLYDSYAVEYLPTEGVTSTDRHLFVEFTSDETGTCTGAAIRYEAFAQGSCYEPFVKYGNFSTSDPAFGVGSVVEFTCEPGYTLEQGAVILECVNDENPQWNETEPACRGDFVCVIPERQVSNNESVWCKKKKKYLSQSHLRLGKNDLLTFYDGDDLTANILGQYSGFLPRFRLYTSTADVTIQFQSDPASNVYGYNNGFVVHFFEVPRNDTCAELPEILNGWKSTSHPDLTHGTVITYQCYPGFRLQGSEILMCQWDLTWSGDVPICEKIMSCEDPGLVDNSRRLVTGSRFSVGSSVEYICNKGYSLSGPGVLTCYSRDTAAPKWSERLPKCVRKWKTSVIPRNANLNLTLYCHLLPGSSSPPYDNMTEESAFDNPVYETGVSMDAMNLKRRGLSKHHRPVLIKPACHSVIPPVIYDSELVCRTNSANK
uniref:Seizure related 6 homolog a n=1 Tax=Sinocyclocheilus rhinocerous TaxID=307959 RepID=A0A673K0X9_9TELE